MKSCLLALVVPLSLALACGPESKSPAVSLATNSPQPQAAQMTMRQKTTLVVRCRDGSRIVGEPTCSTVSVRTAYSLLDIPYRDISSLDFRHSGDSVRVQFRNGDILQGTLTKGLCSMKTLFGELSPPVAALFSITVGVGGPVPGDGLIGFYPFNGNPNDLSGRMNNGVVHGAVLTEDRFGSPMRAYKFNGIDSYIEFSAGWLDPALPGFTISVWIRADEGSKGTIVYTGAIQGECSLSVIDDGIHFSVNQVPNLHDWITTRSPLIANQFVHVAGVYRRGETIQLWVNGELRSETAISMRDLNHGQDSFTPSIGSYSPKHFELFKGFWRGTIDDVRIYDRALGEEEITDLYLAEE
jgi:hypothetical protein